MHWITDETGAVDYAGRVKPLTAVILALIGGLATVYVIFLHRDVNPVLVGIMVGALVTPLTAGKIGDAIMQKVNANATAKVIAGTAPGRRASDPDVHPPTT